MNLRNTSYAILWGVIGAAMAVAAMVVLDANVMFALMFAGVAVACLLVAASCLLMEPRVRRDGEEPEPESPRESGRRHWGPR